MQLKMDNDEAYESLSSESSIKKKKKSKKRKRDEIEQEDQRTMECDVTENVIEPMTETDQFDEINEEDSQKETNKKSTDQTSNYQLDPYSCVEMVHKKIKFPLLPIAINQELKVIRQTLIHKWKYRYINELNGFLYYFDNLEFIADNGRMMDDLPFIYYYITADFYVFRPEANSYLRAKISCFEDSNKVINCSTDCDLTISIPLPEEINEKLNNYLKLHQEIIFLIQNIDYSKMLIEGTINKRCLKLMEKHVKINDTDEMQQEQNGQNESNLDDFFAN